MFPVPELRTPLGFCGRGGRGEVEYSSFPGFPVLIFFSLAILHFLKKTTVLSPNIFHLERLADPAIFKISNPYCYKIKSSKRNSRNQYLHFQI